MGDVGDYWNAHRDFKRAARSQWVECSSPGCQFGGNPVKVAPGSKCRHCGIRAPGKMGADMKFARDDEVSRHMRLEAEEAERNRRLALRTCNTCGKVLASEQGRREHEHAKHTPEHPLKEGARRGFADQGS